MKKLFMVCNAHIDPVWLWNKNDTVGATLSTFRSVVKLLETNDFIFCHNESLLYEIVEKYDKSLFNKIKKLIKEGKWQVMGGWNIQPDCNMPSGETIIRHIEKGREYFLNKFNVKPTVATNFDSFGHSKGLVKILAMTGYEGYVITRPHPDESDIPERFIWKNGSYSVKVVRPNEAYNSLMGEAGNKAKGIIQANRCDNQIMLWGVGNHGGGPSRQDLHDLEELKNNTDVELIYSTPEEYVKNAEFETVVEKSLNPCMPGCYTSQSEVKKTFRKLESEYYFTEKICTQASFETDYKYPEKELKQALNELLFADFHDILPGSAIKDVEKNAIVDMNHALSILASLKFDALYHLSKSMNYAEDCYPFYAYNVLPYKVKVPLCVEFTMKNQNHNQALFTNLKVLVNGKECVSQVVKESSNINLDWVKKVYFECELTPSSVSKIEIYENVIESQKFSPYPVDNVSVKNKAMTVNICGKTGLFDIVSQDKTIVNGGGSIAVIQDTADPWAMRGIQLKSLGDKIDEFKKLEDVDAKNFIFAEKTSGKNFRVIEDGPILTETECMLEYNRSTARVRYTVYKNFNFMDVEISVVANEKNKAFKLEIPVTKGDLSGEIMYDEENFEPNSCERVAQRYLSFDMGDKCLNIYNQGNYGFSYDNGKISLNLLRQPAYSAHPLDGKPFVELDRMFDSIDTGLRTYRFRISLCDKKDNAREHSIYSSLFNCSPYIENIWHNGEGKALSSFVEIDHPAIELVAMYKKNNSYIFRLYNSSNETISFDIKCKLLRDNVKVKMEGKAIKTLVIKKGEFSIMDNPIILK